MKKEIETLQDIEENKCTLRYHIKEESGHDWSMFDIAMDMSHIQDNNDYTKFIQEKLPRLHDQIIPCSLREMAFLEPMLQASKLDWKTDNGKQILTISKKKQNSTMASGLLIYLNYFLLLKLNNKTREIL